MDYTKRTQTLLDEKDRSGTFIRSGQEIGRVVYSLKVTQEVHYHSTPSGFDPTPGLLRGKGEFRSVGQSLSLTEGEELVLRAEDGRERSIQIISNFWGETGDFQLTQASAAEFDPDKRRT